MPKSIKKSAPKVPLFLKLLGALVALPFLPIILVIVLVFVGFGLLMVFSPINSFQNSGVGADKIGKYFVYQNPSNTFAVLLRDGSLERWEGSNTQMPNFRINEVIHIKSKEYESGIENSTLKFVIDLPCDHTNDAKLVVSPVQVERKESVFEESFQEIQASEVDQYCSKMN